MKQFQIGTTLVELLIAITLGLFLLSGLILLYINHKTTYQFNEGISRLQENGRTAIHWLVQDIRMAGYIGCPRLNDVRLKIADFSTQTRLAGWHAHNSTSTLSYPTVIDKIAAINSDVVLIQTAGNKAIKPNFLKNDFERGAQLIIADCNKAEIFTLAANKNFNLTNDYQNNAEIRQLHKIIYYVAKSQRNNKTGQSIYALYRRDLNAPPTVPNELSEGVENMQITYGLLDEAGEVNYLPANNVADWGKVKSVKVALLLNSIEPILDNSQSYMFNKKMYQATDHLYRKEWDVLITLREA